MTDLPILVKACSGGIPVLVALVRDGKGVQIELAAAGLLNLAVNVDNRVDIAAAGGIPPLITLICIGTTLQTTKALGALVNLSANPDNKVAIAAAGGIRALQGQKNKGTALVLLLKYGDNTQKEKATLLTSSLALNDDNNIDMAGAGAIPPLVRLVRDGNAVQKEHAASALWILSVDDSNKVKIQVAGGIPPLMSYLSLESDNKVPFSEGDGILLLVICLFG